MAKGLSIAFFICALLNITGEAVGFLPLRYATKPLLMILLAGWFFAETQKSRAPVRPLLLLALAFSWAGDLLLMKRDELFFLLGLVSFLIAHIFYIIVFRREIKAVPGATLLSQKPYMAVPVLLIYGGLLLLLYSHLEPAMKIPVIVYATVITAMVVTAMNRFQKANSESFRAVFTGALLFMISDSLIAINEFYQPFQYAGFFIMLLYLAGQYLIVRGVAKNTER